MNLLSFNQSVWKTNPLCLFSNIFSVFAKKKVLQYESLDSWPNPRFLQRSAPLGLSKHASSLRIHRRQQFSFAHILTSTIRFLFCHFQYQSVFWIFFVVLFEGDDHFSQHFHCCHKSCCAISRESLNLDKLNKFSNLVHPSVKREEWRNI